MLRALAILIFFPLCLLAEASKIRVGVSVPLSGDAATFGLDIRDGLEFANLKIAQGRFEFIFEDDKCSGRDAVAVAHKLINLEKVRFVTGFGCSETLLAAAPIYEQSKTLVMSCGTAAPKISQAGDYIFRTYPSDVIPAGLLWKYVAARHRKLGILSEDTSYPAGFVDALVANNTGTMTVKRDTFLPGTSDFRSLLNRLTSQGVDGLVVVATSDSELVSVVRQIRNLGIRTPIYSSYLAASPSFLKAAAEAANGIIFPDFPPMDSVLQDDTKQLYREFRSSFGPARTSDFYFVTTAAAITALLTVADAADPRAALYQGSFAGPIGEFRFDNNGDVIGIGQVLNTIRRGRVVPLDTPATPSLL